MRVEACSRALGQSAHARGKACVVMLLALGSSRQLAFAEASVRRCVQVLIIARTFC